MLRIIANAGLRGMLGENAEIPIFAVPALPGREKPVGVLFKSIAEVAPRDFKFARRHHYLRGSVTGFTHLPSHSLKANVSVKMIQENHGRKPAVA